MRWRTNLLTRKNPLEAYFDKNDQRLIHKWLHYFEIYHRHFARFRHRKIVVLEFGVSQGGSLQMWESYFGRRARVHGVDIDPRCKQFESGRTRIFIGDQEDREFLTSVADQIGPVDVLIEDGGHTMGQQIATFEELYPHVSEDGVFLVEDVHTSYWPKYGGGYKRSGTFIEYAKNLIDQQHAWHSRDSESFKVDYYTRSIRGMHIYDSIIVFDKGQVSKPVHKKTGKPSF